MLTNPEPPTPAPSGPKALAATASTTSSTTTLVLDSELWPRPTRDSAGET